ncbi:MAG: hypothetical protein CMO43_11035 [Verrucomicrobiales bacterium]|nr:hypothetical protein [Verrucomicrobiales bacterium]
MILTEPICVFNSRRFKLHLLCLEILIWNEISQLFPLGQRTIVDHARLSSIKRLYQPAKSPVNEQP